jgi:membrane protein implicated in regulation of membrane protease activity
MKLDRRARLHILGIAIGAIAVIWAAIQGDWWFALVFAVATVFLGLGVAHRIRQSQDDLRD